MFALKKKKSFLLGLCALIAAVAVVSVGATWAAVRHIEKAETNVYTIGNVDIELIDEYQRQDNLEPEVQVEKKVAVKNIGTLSCYVRLYIKKGWTVPDGRIDPGADKIVPEFPATGKWVKGDTPSGTQYDGYECWYYQEPVSVNTETDPLIEHFHLMQPDDGKPYAGMEGHITVMAEAVQSDWTYGNLEFRDGKIVNWNNINIQDRSVAWQAIT